MKVHILCGFNGLCNCHLLLQVLFGTTDGQIIVMSSTGAMVSQVTILEGMEITTLLWSCEKFNMEETESNRDSGVKVTGESGELFFLLCYHFCQTTIFW